MRPSYENLLELVHQLTEENRRLAKQNQRLSEQNRRLQDRVKKLEEQLNLNSKNSSKPPSTDQKKNKESPKGGAKKGHPGHHRKLYPSEAVSQTVRSSLQECEHCGCKDLKRTNPQIFQQVEIPEIKPTVTQIELEKATCCSCHKRLIAPFPEDYDKSCFGPTLISFIATSSAVHRMSKRTIQALLKSFFNIEISLGSIPAMERKVSKGLQPAFEALTHRIQESQVAYVDETSFRQCAKTHYVWTVTTRQESWIRILPSRSLTSLDKVRPRGHGGITVTDRYQVYAYKRHQYCLAHIKRDFKKFSQRDGPDRVLGKRALFELNEIFLANRVSCRRVMQQRVSYRKNKLKEILYDAFLEGSEKFSRFAERLIDHFHKLFVFTRYRGVECTNNAAERTLRHLVLWRKTSYGTQSEEGSRFLERAISLWMTLKKQGREVVPFFEQAYRATFQPSVSTPII